MSVRRCQAEVSSREFAGWIAFFERLPFGPMQEDVRAGLVASLIFNANRGRNVSPLGPSDFFPSLKRGRKKKTVREMLELAKLWATSWVKDGPPRPPAPAPLPQAKDDPCKPSAPT
jgi:hypothetical protein